MPEPTVTIQIGNTDGRLSQTEWAAFVSELRSVVGESGGRVHFFGAPPNWDRAQNVACVLELPRARIDDLRARVTEVRKRYAQASAAFTVGETSFV